MIILDFFLLIFHLLNMSGDNEWNGKLKWLFKIYYVLYIVETLYGCTKDCGICCYGCCCTPCLFGSNAEKIDGKNCCLMCCAYGLLTNIYLCWVPHIYERRALRKKYNLKEDPSCSDLCTTVFCGPCALCQEAREMKSRGKWWIIIYMQIFYFDFWLEGEKSVPYKANASSPPVVSQPVSNSDVKNVDPVKVRVWNKLAFNNFIKVKLKQTFFATFYL